MFTTESPFSACDISVSDRWLRDLKRVHSVSHPGETSEHLATRCIHVANAMPHWFKAAQHA